MNADNCSLAVGLVSKSYIRQGEQALARRQRLIKALLSSRKLPEKGWDEATVEMLIRVRGWRLVDLLAGLLWGLSLFYASPLQQLLLFLGKIETQRPSDWIILTLAWGPLGLNIKDVNEAPGWLSGVAAAVCLASGLAISVVLQALSDAIAQIGPDRIAAVVTTTSCFAPRAPDDIVAVARLCAATGLPHVINNAYGVQSRAICASICSAWNKGRVDAVVQSTDKNFMVPVGGAVVAAPASRPDLVAAVNSTYPGRASISPVLDLMMTLLHWGAEGWRQALVQREEVVPYLRARLQEVAARHGERLLATPANPISVALTLDTLAIASAAARAEATSEATKAAATSSTAEAARADDSASEVALTLDTLAIASAAARAEATSEATKAAATSSTAEAARADDSASEVEGGVASSAGEGVGPDTACEATNGLRRGGSPEDAAVGNRAGAAGAGGSHTGPKPAHQPPDVTFFGSMLWSRCVSGTRVVAPGKAQTVGGVPFRNYGSHTDIPYPSTYMTAAAALGTTRADVDELVVRLDRCFAEFRKKVGGSKGVSVKDVC
ncbi:O-phosphoseryl-tRNA(Sec) selenium transferase [Tetrabaena socialis]|uniref:O-phosphoseryl-tRNA(Sec) selenium transferase n=1 Tax=Tetrabaena socialis TaxID=47790 RepID=A0A2J8AKB4_9CHLO|nr:O-phosphoseryl-tRNA(Sec) selenium transferase [Tetrabaena socialis]|eukprot:PNH12955.1 O-phosphoseryl-tRNA(Sec) selenium transferase [Tetrabaena socialis]